MSALSNKQADFASSWVEFLYSYFPLDLDGVLYRYRFGWAYRNEEANNAVGGHPRSNHLNRLAFDLIVDRSTDGVRWSWVSDGGDPVWTYLHDQWEEHYRGAKRIDGDMNHFSFQHDGVR